MAPLAPWLGAACDRLLGRSLPARTGLAALIALAQLAALDRVARRLTSPWRAALATATAVAVAFFQRPGGWMFPFSFDCAAAVTALTWALVVAGRRPRPSDGLAAVCLLVALIARVEMGLVGVAILAFAARREWIRLPRLILFPVASGAIVYAAASSGIPFRDLVETAGCA